MSRRANGCEDAKANQDGYADTDPSRLDMHVMRAHRKTSDHHEESEYV